MLWPLGGDCSTQMIHTWVDSSFTRFYMIYYVATSYKVLMERNEMNSL